MTSSGVPDCPRSSRILLKDYVNASIAIQVGYLYETVVGHVFQPLYWTLAFLVCVNLYEVW